MNKETEIGKMMSIKSCNMLFTISTTPGLQQAKPQRTLMNSQTKYTQVKNRHDWFTLRGKNNKHLQIGDFWVWQQQTYRPFCAALSCVHRSKHPQNREKGPSKGLPLLFATVLFSLVGNTAYDWPYTPKKLGKTLNPIGWPIQTLIGRSVCIFSAWNINWNLDLHKAVFVHIPMLIWAMNRCV